MIDIRFYCLRQFIHANCNDVMQWSCGFKGTGLCAGAPSVLFCIEAYHK